MLHTLIQTVYRGVRDILYLEFSVCSFSTARRGPPPAWKSMLLLRVFGTVRTNASCQLKASVFVMIQDVALSLHMFCAFFNHWLLEASTK